MYNIDLYNYWEKPYSKDKKFTIHPLNEEGKEKYYSDQSHVKHYLKRTDPFVFKSILGYDYDTLVRLQKSDINQLKPLNNTLNQSLTNLKHTVIYFWRWQAERFLAWFNWVVDCIYFN